MCIRDRAVIHSYMRERYAAPGRMVLGSDSHTRYGAYGCMAIGEGGPELARQLLCKTYDVAYPKVIAVYLTGAPRPGTGPQDVALALIGATFRQGIVKNAVLEFFGPGVASLAMDYRSGDVYKRQVPGLRRGGHGPRPPGPSAP